MRKASVTVIIERTRQKRKLNVPLGTSIKEIIKKVNLNSIEIVPAVNNEIVTGDYKVKSNDVIELLSVVSGG